MWPSWPLRRPLECTAGPYRGRGRRHDPLAGRVTYRLLGFDTPETYRSRCAEELSLGIKAKRRLDQLIASGERIEYTGRLDRYGRSLAKLRVNGVDIAATLIEEGLARPYHGEKRASGA